MNPPLQADPVQTRWLVVGSGIAGLQFALLAAESGTVQVVTKGTALEDGRVGDVIGISVGLFFFSFLSLLFFFLVAGIRRTWRHLAQPLNQSI